MILSNLNTNHKIILGVSAITLLTIIYKYIQNIFKPKQNMIEGLVEGQQDMTFEERYGENNNTLNSNYNSNRLGVSSTERANSEQWWLQQLELLKGIYDELGELNHIYQERMFEDFIPSQIKKSNIHLYSSDHIFDEDENAYIFDLSDEIHPHTRVFNSVCNIKLLSITMPFIPYNIWVGDNGISNKINFTDTEYTIPEGSYTMSSLLTAIQTFYVVTDLKFEQDSTSKQITVTNSSNILRTIVINTVSYPLLGRLGFIHGAWSFTDNLVAQNLPDLSVPFIDIIMEDMHPERSTTTTHELILKRLYMTGNLGDIIYYNMSPNEYAGTDNSFPDITSNIHEIKIKLKRHDKNHYDLKGLPFDLHFEITEMVEPTLLNELGAHMRRDKQRFIKQGQGDQSYTDMSGDSYNVNVSNSFTGNG